MCFQGTQLTKIEKITIKNKSQDWFTIVVNLLIEFRLTIFQVIIWKIIRKIQVEWRLEVWNLKRIEYC